MKKIALTIVNLSLTAALTFSTLTLATAGVTSVKNQGSQVTLSATEASTQPAWIASVEDAELRITEDLTEKTNVLNEVANAKFEKQLAAKLATQFTL
jgi:maltose-binding protein MalE